MRSWDAGMEGPVGQKGLMRGQPLLHIIPTSLPIVTVQSEPP